MRMKKCALTALAYVLVAGFFLSAAWFGSRAVTAMAQRTPVARSRTIVIDPGHGGEDGGAVSCTGVSEKQINLEIALGLDDLFHLLGWKTHMTRQDDISVYTTGQTIAQRKISDLKERVNMVNSTENPILISIHQNLYPESQYRGAQVFYGPSGDSEPLARTMQEAFTHTLNLGSQRQIKKATGIYLMEQSRSTGILVECGFLSNPQEEALLRSRDYQQKICCVIVATAANFLDGQT